MALSNIVKEPRREITETVVGVGIVIPTIAAYLFASYLEAMWEMQQNSSLSFGNAMLMGCLACGAIVSFIGLFLIIFHAVGERACDALERRGIRLRPVRESEPRQQDNDFSTYKNPPRSYRGEPHDAIGRRTNADAGYG